MVVEEIIKSRRSVKPGQMNGTLVDDAIIRDILESANWAPTHARTEPWRFIVYRRDKMPAFAQAHAELYKQSTPADKYKEPVYTKLKTVEGASHLVIAYMKRGSNPNIPEVEELAATAAAVQNVLLTAAAKGVSSYWSTSGRTHHPIMKNYLGLGEDDVILGQLYFGYSDSPVGEGMRLLPMDQKVTWM